MKTTDRLKLQLKRKLPAILCAVFIVAILGLYYLGVYDVSFLPRPAAWADHIDRLYTVLFGKDTDVQVPVETEPPVTEPADDHPVKKPNNGDGTPLPDFGTPLEFSTVSALQGEGWRRTDAEYTEGMQFALLDTSYSLPRSFSYTEKTYNKEDLIYFEDGTEPQRQIVQTTERRPALEL